MKEKKPRYDAALKKEIAQVYLEGRRSAPSLASELGVHANTIYKWAEQYSSDPENSFPGSGHMKPDEEELARAKRRVRDLEEEVEILKKAAAYFAKNSK
jgi:transposase